MRLRSVWLTAVVLAAITTGCSGDPGSADDGAPTLPDGAIALTANQPNRSSFQPLVVVAANIDKSGAYVSGWNASGDEAGSGDRVEVGDTIDIEGTTLRLVATWVDPDPAKGVGGSRTKAWVVIEE